jgi:carbon-monoxide dehydrogenase medium subunit
MPLPGRRVSVAAQARPQLANPVKPPQFRYHRPRVLEEALDLMSRLDNGKLLAGGQSLMPMLNFRLAAPEHLIDLNGVPDLAYIRESDGMLTLGAMTRQRDVERSPEIARACPMLGEAIRYVAHPAIRNRGTVGGSLAHLDPAAELPAVAAALDAVVHVASVRGVRQIPMARFPVNVLTSCLLPDEVVTAIAFPTPPAGRGHAFCEFARRHGDFAIVAVAASLELTATGMVRRAALAFAGAGSVPVRPEATERALTGQPAISATFRAAANAVGGELDPPGDIHASRAYRLRLASVLTRRALELATARAQGHGA